MSYIEIVKSEDGITLKLTPEGREELKGYIRTDRTYLVEEKVWSKGTDSILYDLLEDWLCNGWEWLAPEEIGALTSAPILSDEVERDDFGKIVKLGRVYWFPNYAVECELETMLAEGEVFFPAAQEETA